MITAGGFRFYYCFASIYYSFLNWLSLPGDWYGTYVDHLRESLSLFVYPPSEDIFGLEEGFFNVKPLGWLYFTIYDLGFLGFISFLLILLKTYLKEIILGIYNLEYFYISMVAFQVAILIVPVLPSTPCVFLPLSLVAFVKTSKYIKNYLQN